MRKTSSKDIAARLLKALRPYRWLITASILCAAVSVIAQLYIPIVTGNAIDMMIEGRTNFSGISRILIVIGVAIVIASVSQWILGLCNNRVAYSISEDFRNAAVSKIQKLPLAYIDSHPTGDTVGRIIADVEQMSDGLLMGFTQFFTGILTIIGTLIFMFVTSAKIALVVVLVTPLSLIVAAFISKMTFNYFRRRNEIGGRLTAFVNERIEGIRTAKAFGYSDENVNGFDSINEEYVDATTKAVFYSSITNPSVRFVNSVVYASVGLFGALSAITGHITVGQLSCFLTYANQYTRPFNEISGVVAEMQNALSCAGRIFELLDADEEKERDSLVSVDPEDAKGQILIEDVCFSYTKDRELIKDFDLAVRPGQKTAIVGPTGCGKTTLINLLMRFYDVDSGSISVDGTDIRDMSRKDLRRLYGMVLQDTWIKHGTIAENIGYGGDYTREEIIEAAKKAHAHSFIRRMEKGYDTEVSETLGGLSQGQKQLICIARVMAKIPPMLILDEATSSIDTRTEMRIQKAFAEMMRGRTSFIVAHRLSTIKNADMIVVMKDGKILETGTHKDLLKKGGFYAELYNSQFKGITI